MTFTLKDVEKHWEETEEYDEINEKTYSYFRRFTDGYKLSNIQNNALVLDICCRTGNGAIFFSQKRKIKLVCIDVSNRMLGIAKEKLTKEKADFDLIKLSNEAIPLPDEIFDNILSFETIEHMPDPENFLFELSRVLKPKGELILTTPNTAWDPIHSLAEKLGLHHGEGPHRFLPREEIINYLKKANLEINNEKTTVLIPVGPSILTKIGELIERVLPERIMRYIGLRRIFICEKIS